MCSSRSGLSPVLSEGGWGMHCSASCLPVRQLKPKDYDMQSLNLNNNIRDFVKLGTIESTVVVD